MAEEERRVCVTGAGGFVASWLVKLLLSKDYIVHGTVRDPGDEKNAHLKQLEKASRNLQLFKADLLDYNSLYEAIVGCSGVFHVASPVPSGAVMNPEVEIIEPAIVGTLNVLQACSKARVSKVVVVSSGAAVAKSPNWPKNQAKDEACWSDKESCKAIKDWYSFSKTAAEMEALKYAKTSGLNVITVCPCFILGPMLQSNTNASTLYHLQIFKGGSKPLENIDCPLVDVLDVAEALLLTYEKPEAEGRYICLSHTISTYNLVNKLRSIYPEYDYPKNFIEVEKEGKLSSEKLQKLG